MNNLNLWILLNTQASRKSINERYDIAFEYDYKALERTYAEFELSGESGVEALTLQSWLEQNKEYSTCALIDLIDEKIQAYGCNKKISYSTNWDVRML
jgi:hypothetical protein